MVNGNLWKMNEDQTQEEIENAIDEAEYFRGDEDDIE